VESVGVRVVPLVPRHRFFSSTEYYQTSLSILDITIYLFTFLRILTIDCFMHLCGLPDFRPSSRLFIYSSEILIFDFWGNSDRGVRVELSLFHFCSRFLLFFIYYLAICEGDNALSSIVFAAWGPVGEGVSSMDQDGWLVGWFGWLGWDGLA
jgi:hypothetical protein